VTYPNSGAGAAASPGLTATCNRNLMMMMVMIMMAMTEGYKKSLKDTRGGSWGEENEAGERRG
jgi:hypothetical protein